MTNLPSPGALLGIPNRFLSWYPGQEEVFNNILAWYHGPDRFLGLSIPAGSGKSIDAVLTAKMTGARTAILTVTKGLQDQYMRDIAEIGGVQVKGRNNFPCTLVPGLTAEEGPCHEGLSCSFRSSGCPYYQQLSRALTANLVVTNYAYYLAQTRFSSGLGEFRLLVLDEAHLTFSALEKHFSIPISRFDVEPLGISLPKPDSSWEAWQEWAGDNEPAATSTLTKLERDMSDLRRHGGPVPSSLSRSYHTAKSVAARLRAMAGATGHWAIDYRRRSFVFTPVWVSQYGPALFGNIPKVMLMSALLSRKTLDIIGVPVDGCGWFAANSHFPAANTPIYHVSTSQISHRSDDYKLTIWLSRIDQIIQRRLDRKGIIFTVSYDRAHLILRSSRFSHLMLSHSTGDVVSVVRKFKTAEPPVVLVSPTVTSGWDLPEADYIIVAKIPWPDTTDVVLKARREEDKDWPAFLAMETLVNESSRATRSVSDRCEVLIVDDNWFWVWGKYQHFAPDWFRQRVRGSLNVVPEVLI